jgi:osmotically-inducible protein OsmY
VLDGGKLIGILTRADFVRALAALVAPSYEEPATSDLEIAERIHDDLRVQPWALNSHVVVRVDRGHVELRGRALDEDQRDAARVLAENVAGVQSVVNDIVCDAPSIWSETDG